MFIDFLRLCGYFLPVQRNPPLSNTTEFLPAPPFLLLLTLGGPSSFSFSIACPFSESVTSLQLRFAIFLATPESLGLARLALPESSFQRGCVALAGPVPPTPTPATESPRRRAARRGTLLSLGPWLPWLGPASTRRTMTELPHCSLLPRRVVLAPSFGAIDTYSRTSWNILERVGGREGDERSYSFFYKMSNASPLSHGGEDNILQFRY